MSKKNKPMCQTCANQVNGSHCTMFKQMEVSSRDYKKCDGYKIYAPPQKKEVIVKQEKPINYEELGTFGRFLKSGGGYSFRTGKFIGVNNWER